MIRVDKVEEPPTFDKWVRLPGKDDILKLQKKYPPPKEIPPGEFPTHWTTRREDGKNTIDDLRDRYKQRCAYLAMRIERVGGATVDHFVPKGEQDVYLVYEWSNYRLCASCVNAAKKRKTVVDPFDVELGWFKLNFNTLEVECGENAPQEKRASIEDTCRIVNTPDCITYREEYLTDYRSGELPFSWFEKCAPFLVSELRRKNDLNEGDL